MLLAIRHPNRYFSRFEAGPGRFVLARPGQRRRRRGDVRLIAPDWRMYGGPPGLPSGHAGLRALFGHIGPVEQKWTVDDVIAEGDRVVVRGTNCCTQEELFGVPARGKRQVFTATFTLRIADQLVAEVWRNADDLGRLLQLGARLVPGE